MKSSRKLFLALSILSILLACAPPNPNPTLLTTEPYTNRILVSLTEPLDGEAYPISATLSVRGEAISDGSISRMELWADGELFETYTAPESGLGLLAYYWNWSPKALGWHSLLVRAYDEQGQSALSNSIYIEGIPDPGFTLITKIEEGDTILSLAEKYRVRVNDILEWNPQLAGLDSLPVGMEILIQVEAQITSYNPSIKAKLSLIPDQQAVIDALSQGEEPTLSVSGEACAATLLIGDLSANEEGFNIYRLDPGAIAFKKLTVLPAHDGGGTISFQDVNLYGQYQYYVTAFAADEELSSSLATINIANTNCAGTLVQVSDLGILTTGVEEYYLYLAVNGGEWRRFPADDFVFLKQSDGMDFGTLASKLAPNATGDITLRGEAWGMINGTATLLGTFEKTFKAQPAPAAIGPFFFQNILMTKLEVRGVFNPSTANYPWYTEKGTGYTPEYFHYGTDVEASYGIWQVASVPFGKEVSFNPACLLLSGKANGSGTLGKPFEFGIDFSLLKPKIENLTLSPFVNLLIKTPIFSSPFSPEKLNEPMAQVVYQPQYGGGGLEVGGAIIKGSFDPCAQNVSAEGIITYYVQVIPMNNGQAAGAPSNTVKMIYDPQAQIKFTLPAPPPLPQDPYYDVKILSFTGVHYPIAEYTYCVEVTEVSKGTLTPYPYKPGDKICPKTHTGGGTEIELLEYFKKAVNIISSVYNKLSDWAVEWVDKLNPLCIQAKMASSTLNVGEKQVKDACHYVAEAVVAAAKTYVGLPPSLPNFDQLTELGKDNLIDLAAQELENSGIPCPEDCKNVIRKGMDLAIEQVKASMNNSSCISEKEANSHGFEPLCLPSGIITQPDPRGQPSPAILEVQVTRRPNTTGPKYPEPTSCAVQINAPAVNLSHVGGSWSTAAGFQWIGTSISGNLYNTSSAFPTLAPNESVTFPIILKPYSYWLPGHEQFVKQGWKPEHYDDWNILYQGAVASIEAGGSCKFEFTEGTGFTDKVVIGDSLQVGPLGKAIGQTCEPYNCP